MPEFYCMKTAVFAYHPLKTTLRNYLQIIHLDNALLYLLGLIKAGFGCRRHIHDLNCVKVLAHRLEHKFIINQCKAFWEMGSHDSDERRVKLFVSNEQQTAFLLQSTLK